MVNYYVLFASRDTGKACVNSWKCRANYANHTDSTGLPLLAQAKERKTRYTHIFVGSRLDSTKNSSCILGSPDLSELDLEDKNIEWRHFRGQPQVS